MNRPIKFRAWIPEFETMVKVEGIGFDGGDEGPYIWHNKLRLDNASAMEPESQTKPECATDLDKCDLMQFTGLKDKNGRDIYEGDIIRVRTVRVSGSQSTWYQKTNLNHGHVFINCYVIYNQEHLEWQLRLCRRSEVQDIEAPRGAERDSQHVHVPFSLFDRDCCQQGEVSGNIYENPELLEAHAA